MEQKIRYFLPLVVLITGVFLSMYVLSQQVLRQDANDPQIQMSEDIANALSEGKEVKNLVPQKIELTQSIAPFIIIYDKNGKVISSTVALSGETPDIPQGVLLSAKANGQNRLTWQPATNVREAIVVTYFNNKSEGYVLAGRSLQEVEQRENQILKLAGIGWIATLVGSFLAVFLFIKSSKK